jgi:hypothetical protein
MITVYGFIFIEERQSFFRTEFCSWVLWVLASSKIVQLEAERKRPFALLSTRRLIAEVFDTAVNSVINFEKKKPVEDIGKGRRCYTSITLPVPQLVCLISLVTGILELITSNIFLNSCWSFSNDIGFEKALCCSAVLTTGFQLHKVM